MTDVAPNDPPRGAPLSGKRVQLREVHPSDYDYLYALASNEKVAYRWRYRGTTPGMEQFVQQLWQNVLSQFLIEHRETKQRIGYALAFDANLRNGFCHIAMVLDPALMRAGWALESGTLFVNYLFTNFNLRKLYGVSPDFAYQDFASGAGSWFREEGRMKDHEWYDGQYWDQVLLAMYREDWEKLGPPLVEKLTRGRDQA